MTLTSRRNSRSPAASNTTPAKGTRPASPNTPVSSARTVPGEPSGSITTSSNSPAHRLNDAAFKTCPNSGCLTEMTRTSHGNTERRCCSEVFSLIS
jgi:hypothetical protein